MPMALPLSASTNPSVSNCRIRRRRLAPSDRRMPISLTRAAARASSRLPMFAHATSHTSSNPAEMADAAANGPTESDRPGREANCGPGHDDAAWAHAVGQHELAAQEVQFGASLFARGAGRQPSGDVDAAGDRWIVRLQLRRRGHGEKQLLAVGGLRAREVAGRDADDRERHLVDANVGADDGRVAAKVTLPVVVRQHRDGLRASRSIVVRAEAASRRDADSQHVEEVSGDEEAPPWIARCRRFRPAPLRHVSRRRRSAIVARSATVR